MNSFDDRARTWDLDQIHVERSAAIASCMESMIPLDFSMKALEYGAGTGLLSFLLHDKLKGIVLMDNSRQMIKVCEEKISFLKIGNMHPVHYDLEHMDYPGKFDLIYTQMVLHHVKSIDLLLNKFYSLLNPGGYLTIADLCTEDGSFHGADADVHRGFDPESLGENLKRSGFKDPKFRTCYKIEREDKSYPLFTLIAQKL